MARFIEVLAVETRLANVKLETGDVLLFHASGGRVLSGNDVVECIGPFVSSLLPSQGEVLTPMGPPNKVLFLARKAGQATIELITGEPFYTINPTTVDVVVDP